MARSEPVFPGSRRRVKTDQSGDASQLRYVTQATLNEPQLQRNPSYAKELDFINDDPQSNFEIVWSGRDDPRESDVDTDVESASVSIVEYATEEIQLDGLNTQDSNDIDSNFSSPNSSLTPCPVFNTQPSEEGNTFMINMEESEVQMSIEETNKETYNVSVMTMAPTECEDTSLDASVAVVVPKAVQNAIPPESPEQKQEDVAKVLVVSSDWRAEFPPDEWVVVKQGEEVHVINGCLRTLVYSKVKQVNHQLLSKLKKLSMSPRTGSVVAYLEDEKFGYIVKECLERLTTVVDRIVGCQKTVTEELTKIDKIKHHTANTMSLRRAKLSEQKCLKQLLTNLVTGPVTANECLHQHGFVSLNLRLSNLFVRFNCDCWDKPSCTHGPSAVTVVMGDCELAHPVDSLIDEPTNSKAMKLLDAMHKYKRAKVVYDNLDVVFCVIRLLTMISGNKDCRKKLSAWTHNITKAVFIDPPVVEVRRLFKECGVPQNDTSKVIDHLKVSTAHYARLYGEHEV